MTLLLTNAEVERALPMADCLAGMEEAYKDLGRARAATGVRSEILTPTTREDALYSLLTMNGAVPAFGVSAVRINSDILTWPAGEGSLKRVKVPSAPGGRYVGLVLLFSTETGEPLAVYPDGIVQRMRVGATSGLAAKYLAREDARTVALLGAGWQAGGQAMAIAAVRPVTEIRCFSPRAESREAFAADMTHRLGIEVVPVSSTEEAVAGADVVLCATNSMRPILPPELIAPGMHVSSLKRLELAPETVARADVAFTHVHGSELRIVRTEGADLARDTEHQKDTMTKNIRQGDMPTLPDLLLGRAPGRRTPEQVTMFLNYAGLGFQFAGTGHVIYQNALRLGLGHKLPTDWLTSELPS